ncbi:ATP-binding cassette domain-containing protein, partial [Algiphilus sp.]|uniref:ATP-binding cassette domain-containing protein n=1 Tax=Algiphilus sp. TaxID=1872431 RepID=UPI003C519E86
MHPIIVSENLCKSVSSGAQKLDILRGVDIAVHRGETVSIVGASGSGKTTLLALLAGLDSPTSGRVVLDGAEISAMDEEARAAARASRVGFVFQSFQLLGGFTALENVM